MSLNKYRKVLKRQQINRIRRARQYRELKIQAMLAFHKIRIEKV